MKTYLQVTQDKIMRGRHMGGKLQGKAYIFDILILVKNIRKAILRLRKRLSSLKYT